MKKLLGCIGLSLLAISVATGCADSGTGLEQTPAQDAPEGVRTATQAISGWNRTVIFIKAETSPGQDMFIRGGLDHDFMNALGRGCTTSNYNCAIRISHQNHLNATTNPWKTGDLHLDWYGRESGQTGWSHGIQAEGTPADWTTNYWPPEWGPAKHVSIDGYGYTPENTFGMHYWMLDVSMNCNDAYTDGTGTSWFEIKTYISGGIGWETDIHQAGTPYVSNNHFAKCGKVNVFERGSNSAQYL